MKRLEIRGSYVMAPEFPGKMATEVRSMFGNEYRSCKLTPVKSGTGWQVLIGATGMATGVHSDQSGAFAEARTYVDALHSQRRRRI
jgi:hypothetical protein